jgi:hypothetical protein
MNLEIENERIFLKKYLSLAINLNYLNDLE